MAIDQTTRETQLLTTYADTLRTEEGLDALVGSSDTDTVLIEQMVGQLGEATSLGFTVDSSEGGSLSAIEDPAANAQYSKWHGALAGQMAQHIEEIGFDVHQVEVKPSGDTFYADFGDIPVEIGVAGGSSAVDVLGQVKELYELMNTDGGANDGLIGGVKSVSYADRSGTVVFGMSESDSIYLATEQLTAEKFQNANKVLTALSQLESTTSSRFFTGAVTVDAEGNYYAEYKYQETDGGKWDEVNLGDVSSLSPEDIRTKFTEMMDATAPVYGTDAEGDASAAAPDALGILNDSAAVQADRLSALDALPSLWQTADTSTKSKIITAIFVALNADGNTADGQALNEAGITALGGLTGSARAASILSQIAINAFHITDTYNVAYSKLAQRALQSLHDASAGNTAIAALLDKTNTALATA